MKCEVPWHPRGASSGPSLLQAAGVVVGVAVGVAVVRFAESLAAVVLLAVYVPCAVCIAALAWKMGWLAALVRLIRARLAANQRLTSARLAPAALPAPRRMLEQARPEVYVITDARERISQ